MPTRITVADGQRSTEITDPSEILANLIDCIPAFVWTAGPTKECTYFNRAWLDYRGRTLQQELVDGFTFGIHPDDTDKTIERYLNAFDNRELYETEYRICDANGEYHWVLDRGMPVYRAGDGEFLGYAGTCVDIDARKKLERDNVASQALLSAQYESLNIINSLSTKLHESLNIKDIVDETETMLLAANQHVKIATYLADKNGNFYLFSSQGFEEKHIEHLTKIPVYNSGSPTEIKVREIELTTKEDNIQNAAYNTDELLVNLENASGISVPLVHHSKPLGQICLWFNRKNQFQQLEIDTLTSIGKTVSLALAGARNRAELEYRADHDSLTGLANRAYLHKQFTKFIASHSDKVCALLLIDLDRFKEINDTLGHDIGDEVLKNIEPQLSPLLNKHNTELIRLGGDEFVIPFYDVNNRQDIAQFAGQLMNSIRTPMRINNMLLEIDASVGVALYPENGVDSRALLRAADVAMYESKRSGVSVTFYDKTIDKNSLERLSLITELRGGIQEKQLILHYQPKVNLANNKIVGFEALVRWQHQSMGLLYPDTFMPVAEVSDAIHFLTNCVMEEALIQHAYWQSKKYNFNIAINISPRNLVDDRCIHYLQELMEKYQTPPENVELEITETVLLQDPDGASRLLKRIAELGIKLSIDDFGTGYSSLAYLRKLPIHTLKIDRLFVSNMLNSDQDTAIVRSVIALAHNLNLTVVAEGVEDKETMERLADMGCDIAQGYHISKPMEFGAIEKSLLRSHTFTK